MDKNLTEYEKQQLTAVKIISIALASLAVITWLVCSVIIFKYKEKNSTDYEIHFALLNEPQQAICTGLEKTGAIEASIGDAFSVNRRKSDSKFFEDISNIHKNDKKK
ncbi:hypothetical protein [Treponema sp.]|uniref:hypothetical protein n=1 Tax=Treponema sp. TaxID=166 RepID=UPI00298DC6AA|nr:hypothetical protein [Treponema sp.]